MILSLIVAADENNCIGGENKLLWKLPDDLRRFRDLTQGHTVIMGRKTYDSIGKALPNRRNIVITRQSGLKLEGCDTMQSLDSAIESAKNDRNAEVFVIGGADMYALAMPKAHRIYLTRVEGKFKGDAYFPAIDPALWTEMSNVKHAKNNKHLFQFAYINYERVK